VSTKDDAIEWSSSGASAAVSSMRVALSRVKMDKRNMTASIVTYRGTVYPWHLSFGSHVAWRTVWVSQLYETAGRRATMMLVYLKKHRAVCKTILVEKTDRLYRNLKDWTTLDDLGTTIHLIKEGRIIGPDSGSFILPGFIGSVSQPAPIRGDLGHDFIERVVVRLPLQ
jgi:hypothetical protein